MRPLILQPDSEPYGACRALLRTIEAMPAGSAEPLVVFPYDGAALDEYRAAGCEVAIADLAVLRRAAAHPAGLLDLARGMRSTGRAVAELARGHRAKLIHTNSMTVVTGASAARRAGVPHVWQLREAPHEGGMKVRALRMLLERRADLVLAVSEAAARVAGPRVATQVIHDGYDLPERPRSQGEAPASPIARPGELLVGMVGRIIPTKAPHLAVEALALAQQRHDETHDTGGLRLALAGTVYPGHERYAQEQVLDRARALGVADRLEVLGWLDDPAPLLEQLDVFVVATGAGEGFGGAVLEALAHGVPVVSAATGGVDELVLDGRTGIACPPGDAEAIAAALERLARDPALRDRLAAAGREHAAQFTVQRSADALLAAWRTLA